MNRFKRKRTFVILLIILSISIGFAVLTQQLDLLGTTNVFGNTWNVHWENVILNEDSTDQSLPLIDANRTSVTYTINLNEPGDYYEFYVDAVNGGSLDAMIKNYSLTVLKGETTTTLPSYLTHSVTYINNKPLAAKQLLEAGKSVTYKVRVEFKEDITGDDLDENDTALKLRFTVNYQQANSTAVKINVKNKFCTSNNNVEVPEGTVCKRAEVLHEELCQNTSAYACKADGYTVNTEYIVYGNCGTQGTLTSGDAFTCDVNDDGNFDETQERFYYVAPKDGDTSSEDVTLIYYKTLVSFKYHNSSNNYSGPVGLINSLPLATTWTNTGLNTGMTRQIVNENGEATTQSGERTIVNYTYTARAARLLTAQEVNSACGITVGVISGATTNYYNQLNTCEYLLENTTYAKSSNTASWWLETPRSDSNSMVLVVNGTYGYVSSSSTTNSNGVRPAIEVPKSKISY